MKHKLIVALAMLAVPLFATTCSVPAEIYPQECDPHAIIPSARCKELLASDAGSDADAEPTKGPMGIDDPGLNPEAWRPCGDGFCAPELSGQSALVWEKVPVSLYVGPNDGTPLACPDNLTEVGRLFDELVAPTAACEACICEASKGECSQPPEKIEIRAGACAENGVPFSPFDGPPNWSGSCSSAGGLSAGAMCGNEPCAQSVWASPLPPPANDACLPSTSIPLSTKEFSWNTRAIACEAKTEQGACLSEKQYCAADLGPEWLTCVHQKGIHSLSDCPNQYNASVHRLYPHEPVDDRGCSDCSCGAPAGSACLGVLRLYDEAACSAEVVPLLLSSMGEGCTNIFPAGRATGAKRVTDLAYLPGTCGPIGGEPKGMATGDAANAVTFCCMKPSPPKQSQSVPG
jgi:hypothetical protein